jgi:hypothetical protein
MAALRHLAYTSAMRQPHAQRRVLLIALGLLYAIVLAWQAPHLVHHAFETHTTQPDECALAAAADHGPASIDAPALDVPIHHGVALRVTREIACRAAGLSTAPSRAPPTVLA